MDPLKCQILNELKNNETKRSINKKIRISGQLNILGKPFFILLVGYDDLFAGILRTWSWGISEHQFIFATIYLVFPIFPRCWKDIMEHPCSIGKVARSVVAKDAIQFVCFIDTILFTDKLHFHPINSWSSRRNDKASANAILHSHCCIQYHTLCQSKCRSQGHSICCPIYQSRY